MIGYSTADEELFDASADTCGTGDQWCSHSCRVLGVHVLVVPREGEMYGETLARVQAERVQPERVAA